MTFFRVARTSWPTQVCKDVCTRVLRTRERPGKQLQTRQQSDCLAVYTQRAMASSWGFSR